MTKKQVDFDLDNARQDNLRPDPGSTATDPTQRDIAQRDSGGAKDVDPDRVEEDPVLIDPAEVKPATDAKGAVEQALAAHNALHGQLGPEDTAEVAQRAIEAADQLDSFSAEDTSDSAREEAEARLTKSLADFKPEDADRTPDSENLLQPNKTTYTKPSK